MKRVQGRTNKIQASISDEDIYIEVKDRMMREFNLIKLN